MVRIFSFVVRILVSWVKFSFVVRIFQVGGVFVKKITIFP